jgi:hypothetical protein
MECGALFDLFNALANLSPDKYRAGKLLRTRIGAMLATLCLSGRVTTLFRVRSRLRARACSRPETPILPTRFHEEPFFFQRRGSPALRLYITCFGTDDAQLTSKARSVFRSNS